MGSKSSKPRIGTILIVDDVSANRKALVTLLRDHGHRVVEACDGSAGLAAVRAQRPDLVITDVLMPLMDGYEFVKQLRVDPATRDIPVVFYTAHYSQREARALALSSGVSAVLTKPADAADVLDIVNRLLAGEPAVPALSNVARLSVAYDREHLRLLTNPLSEKAGDLKAANVRLRALINIGLEFSSQRHSTDRLQTVCASACDLFRATYVTLGILDRNNRTVQHFVTCGVDVGWMKTGDFVSGIIHKVIADQRPLRGQNPGGDPAALQLPPVHPEVQAYLAAPISSTDYVCGWICLVGNEGQAFSEEDEDLVMALAGQVGRICELDYEIVERKQAEEALRHERDRAQQYLDTPQVILLGLDIEGRITLLNRYGSAVLGWTEEELQGRDWAETCLPASTREAMRKQFDNLIAGDFMSVENLVLCRSGEERLIEWRNTLSRDDAGQITGTFSSGTDITERTQAITALRTAEERMRFALEASRVGIWDMDYITGTLRWSEIIESHYGMNPGTFSGTFDAFIEAIHPDDRESVIETIGKAAASGTDFTIQNRALWPDGTVRWLTGAGRIRVGADGKPVRGVGISLDVTERHTVEEQSQQAQKMEAIGRLAGGVAHDFNNLLTAILGYCELLLAGLEPDDPRHADVTEIQRAGTSAAGLTRQLLAFSRKQIIEPTALDLNVVVAEMRAMLERVIREDVNVVFELQPDLFLVQADRAQMEQIVLNLAVNARDAMPAGGTLTIKTANVDLDDNYAKAHTAVTPGPYVVLTVSDTGVGMTPEVRAHVFEPFFTTKPLGRGTGLGLATVQSIVTRSGGSVGIHSEAGKGTSFSVYFPKNAAVSAGAVPLIVRPPSGTETILVVEDVEGLRQLTKRLLQRQGYTVIVAANVQEAVRMFDQNGTIDVVLTDVVMPGASGPELIRQLVERRPGLKTIYMSGYTDDTIVHHGVLNPGIAFLHKPFSAEALGRKIREVLDQHALASLNAL